MERIHASDLVVSADAAIQAAKRGAAAKSDGEAVANYQEMLSHAHTLIQQGEAMVGELAGVRR